MVPIVSAGRLRKSPFYESTIRDGAESLLTYNRMLIPRGYGDREAEYWRLINGVSMWDVAVQRQVQIKGPDASKLTQILCTRDLSQQEVGQGKYVALCDHNGVLINDPIAMKIDDNCYWLSIGNSDIWFWARCVAGERNLNVEISEPDVSPMAIQGPKAEEVVASLFGNWVKELGYFWFKDVMLENIPITLMRAGWSKQGGFELFLKDGTKGNQLWDIVKEAGQPFDIGPGYPNPSERTESGLLNWGIDTDDETNPFEVRLERFVDLDIRDDVIGINALREIKKAGVKRHQLGVILDSDYEDENQAERLEILKDDTVIGELTHRAWSYRLQRMIGYGLVTKQVDVGDKVDINYRNEPVSATLSSIPFAIS